MVLPGFPDIYPGQISLIPYTSSERSVFAVSKVDKAEAPPPPHTHTHTYPDVLCPSVLSPKRNLDTLFTMKTIVSYMLKIRFGVKELLARWRFGAAAQTSTLATVLIFTVMGGC